jgi:hypothetical protein
VIASAGGKIYQASARPGNNTSASYSPDGREIACTLSMDGNPEIYLLDARGSSPRRLTNARAIDTSPSFSPTGREMAFTSDRGGSPQVYVMDHEGGNVRRLTFDVDYTDSPPGRQRAIGSHSSPAPAAASTSIHAAPTEAIRDWRFRAAATRIPAGHRTDAISCSHRIAKARRDCSSPISTTHRRAGSTPGVASLFRPLGHHDSGRRLRDECRS